MQKMPQTYFSFHSIEKQNNKRAIKIKSFVKKIVKFCQNLTFAWKKKLKFGFDKWNTKKFEKFRCDLGLDEKKC